MITNEQLEIYRDKTFMNTMSQGDNLSLLDEIIKLKMIIKVKDEMNIPLMEQLHSMEEETKRLARGDELLALNERVRLLTEHNQSLRDALRLSLNHSIYYAEHVCHAGSQDRLEVWRMIEQANKALYK